MAKSIGEKARTEAQEKANPKDADEFYERCGRWLREHTTDTKKFKKLFEENLTYGFRRNLFGLKSWVLGLDVVIATICNVLIIFDLADATAMYVMLGIALVHVVYFVLAVTREAVVEAANLYGRQLLLACEVLMPKPTKPKSTTK